jgi:hypothetical protein
LLDTEVAGVIHAYLLAGWPLTLSPRLFVLARARTGPAADSGRAADEVRYHQHRTWVTVGNPHALRDTIGTELAEASR